MIDRHRRVQGDPQTLPEDVAETANLPCRAKVSVERVRGATFRRVGHDVAVCACGDVGHADIASNAVRIGARVRKDHQSGVFGVGHEGARIRGLGVSVVLPYRPPSLCTFAIGIGDNERGAVRGQCAQCCIVASKCGAVQHRTRRVDEARNGEVHQAIAIAGNDRRRIDRLGPDQRVWLEHHTRRKWGRIGNARRRAQLDLVDQRTPGISHTPKGRAIRRCGAKPTCSRKCGPQGARSRPTVPFELDVIAHEHIACCEQSRDRRNGRRLEHALLGPTIEGADQVDRTRRAERRQLSPDPGSIEEPGDHRVLCLTPPICSKIGARQFEYARGVRHAVQRCGGVAHIRRELLGKSKIGRDERTGEQRLRIRDAEDRNATDKTSRKRAPTAVRACPFDDGPKTGREQERIRKADERHRTRRVP